MKELFLNLQKEFKLQPASGQIGSDFAVPCFDLTKTQREKQMAAINESPLVAKTEIIGGYINGWWCSEQIASLLAAWPLGAHFGHQAKRQETIVIDYFGVNLAKDPSVGHLRNIFQGRALTNLYQALGYDVITDNHLGDWGRVFGIWVVGFEKFSTLSKLKENGNQELGRVYAKMTQALKKEAKVGGRDLADQVQAWLLKLESGDRAALDYHQLFTNISLQDTQKFLDKLGIEFDEQLGESFYQPLAKKLLLDLEQSALAKRQADNSLIVDLEPCGIKTPLLLQKSNGANLYATSDIATLSYRQTRWQPAEIIYVVGSEQKFHFKQIFAFNQLANYTKAKLTHHAYGLVEELKDGKRVKMSSRDKVVFAQDVLDQAKIQAQKIAKDSLSGADVEKIAFGALVFQEFSQNYQKNTLFDWEKTFDVGAMSGPYVQYALVRLGAIINKAPPNLPLPQFSGDWQPEHSLLVYLLNFPDLLISLKESRQLHRLALYVYDFCRHLNRYYEQTPVLAAPPQICANRLWLLGAINDHLRETLRLLGISIPSQM